MNIVEFALKLKDLASVPLQKFGTTAGLTFNKTKQLTENLSTHNKVLGRSYEEIQKQIRQVEKTIRTSTIPSQIATARRELEALQRQAKAHPGNVQGGLPGKKGGGMAGMAGIGMMKSVGIGLALGAVAGVGMLANKAVDFASAGKVEYAKQAEAEAKLGAVMRNTMNARFEDFQSVLSLSEVQQKQGVVGTDVQIAGSQELATCLTKSASLRELLPTMNDMLAQQYGLNASQEQAINIGSMLGKVMDGQVGALSRYGYKFDKTQEKILKFGTESQRVATLVEVVGSAVGGVNKALAETDLGQLKRHANEVTGLQTKYGKLAVALQAAFAPLTSMAVKLGEYLLPIVESFVKPITAGIKNVVELIRNATDGTSNWGYFLQNITNLFTNHIAPTVGHILTAIGEMTAGMVDFLGKSELVKDVFDIIISSWKMNLKILLFMMEEMKRFIENVVLPPLKLADSVYRMVKGTKAPTPTTSDAEKDKMTKKTQQSLQQVLDIMANTSGNNTTAAAGAMDTITGGGQKIINIHVAKFLDYISINPISMKEGEADIEKMMLEMFSRVVTQGGR